MLKQGSAVKVVRFLLFVFFVQEQETLGRDSEAFFCPPPLLLNFKVTEKTQSRKQLHHPKNRRAVMLNNTAY